MLINFTVSNYKSFKSSSTLSMIKSKERMHKEHVIENIAGFNLLKGAIIYGANASGKSNLIDAFAFATSFILNGRKDKESINPQQFLLDKDCTNANTSFEFEFVVGNKAFSYGFVVTNKEVIEEWLCKINKNEDVDDKFLYTREGNYFEIGTYLKTEEADELSSRFEFVKSNELFLTKSIELNSDILRKYVDWFHSVQIIRPNSRPLTIIPNLNNQEFKHFLSRLLKTCGTGIEKVDTKFEDVKILELSEDVLTSLQNDLNENEGAIVSSTLNIGSGHPVVVKQDGELKAQVLQFTHKDKNNNDVKFTLAQESDGTKRLVELSVAFFSDKLKVLVIDELDKSLHPALTQFLCKSFLNKNDKQLIITTHETSLLNKNWIRRDEIWFVNKEKYTGVSSLKPLLDYNQRYDKELRRAYLDGRYHGVPVFGDYEW